MFRCATGRIVEPAGGSAAGVVEQRVAQSRPRRFRRCCCSFPARSPRKAPRHPSDPARRPCRAHCGAAQRPPYGAKRTRARYIVARARRDLMLQSGSRAGELAERKGAVRYEKAQQRPMIRQPWREIYTAYIAPRHAFAGEEPRVPRLQQRYRAAGAVCHTARCRREEARGVCHHPVRSTCGVSARARGALFHAARPRFRVTTIFLRQEYDIEENDEQTYHQYPHMRAADFPSLSDIAGVILMNKAIEHDQVFKNIES